MPLFYCLGGVYTATTTIGTQDFELNIDTGSTSLGVASTSCTTCGVSPEYTPGSTATDEKQTTNAQYGSGSWSGEVYQDDVAMAPATAFPLPFASITSQNSFFNQTLCNSKNQGMQGILGMGPDQAVSPHTEGYFTGLVAAQKIPNIFSIELCDSGGTLWLGGVDNSVMTAPPQWVPMIGQFAGYYAVDLRVGHRQRRRHDDRDWLEQRHHRRHGHLDVSHVDHGVHQHRQRHQGGARRVGLPRRHGQPDLPGGRRRRHADVRQHHRLQGGHRRRDAGHDVHLRRRCVTVQATATESYLFPLQSEWCSGL